MDCENVRDRFSSLWEKELTASEEKIVRGHLSSCPECQKEFEQFEKTMQWLRSVDEVEVPNGLLRELHEEIKERKSKGALGQRSGGRWFNLPLSLKLPVQAVAMVAIVFLVLYLTKMMPMEAYRLKEIKQTSSRLSLDKDSEQAKAPAAEEEKLREKSIPQVSAEKESRQLSAQKGVENERRAIETTAETSRQKDVEQGKAPAPREEKLGEPSIPPAKVEAKKAEPPSPRTEGTGHLTFDSREAGRAKASPEPGKIGKALAAKEKSVVASKPPPEIILRISDRGEAISQLNDLIKRFEGEILASEENMLLVSLPTGLFSEFEKELVGLSAAFQADKMTTSKHVAGSLRAAPGAERQEVEGKSKAPAKRAADTENRTIVRILLVQE